MPFNQSGEGRPQAGRWRGCCFALGAAVLLGLLISSGRIFLGEAGGLGDQSLALGSLTRMGLPPLGPASVQGAAPAAFPTGPVLHREFLKGYTGSCCKKL